MAVFETLDSSPPTLHPQDGISDGAQSYSPEVPHENGIPRQNGGFLSFLREVTEGAAKQRKILREQMAQRNNHDANTLDQDGSGPDDEIKGGVDLLMKSGIHLKAAGIEPWIAKAFEKRRQRIDAINQRLQGKQKQRQQRKEKPYDWKASLNGRFFSDLLTQEIPPAHSAALGFTLGAVGIGITSIFGIHLSQQPLMAIAAGALGSELMLTGMRTYWKAFIGAFKNPYEYTPREIDATRRNILKLLGSSMGILALKGFIDVRSRQYPNIQAASASEAPVYPEPRTLVPENYFPFTEIRYKGPGPTYWQNIKYTRDEALRVHKWNDEILRALLITQTGYENPSDRGIMLFKRILYQSNKDPLTFFKALMLVESRGIPNQINTSSGKPCVGLYQIMSKEAGGKMSGRPSEEKLIKDPIYNIHVAAQLFHDFLDYNGNDLRKALQMWNGSENFPDLVFAVYDALQGKPNSNYEVTKSLSNN